ncbi:MAG: efflux RND transporter periplasmic adaptor subunit [Paludibacteraceae bacterium]|nr:efflux RND transporter periplasmic adaptor subunit [Prevotellaceae bacterium]
MLRVLSAMLLVLLLSVWSCRHKQEPSGQVPSFVAMKVSESTVPTYVDMVGQAGAMTSVNIVTRIEGVLEGHYFKDGAVIPKGTVLYRIQRTQYENELLAAKAQLESNQASYVQARDNLRRMESLINSKAVSKATYDSAVAAEKEARAAVDQAQANYKVAQLNYSYTEIAAPFTGMISKGSYSVGNLVSPSSGTLATMTSVDPIFVDFEMNENKYLAIISDSVMRRDLMDTKNPPKVTLILPGQKPYSHQGFLDYISPTVDPETGTLDFRATVPNPDNLLRPGNYVTVRLVISENRKGVVVPQSVLTQVQNKYFVYKLDGQNKVSQTVVTTGSVIGNNIQILAGLNPGDVILTEGFQMVQPGMKVNPILK